MAESRRPMPARRQPLALTLYGEPPAYPSTSSISITSTLNAPKRRHVKGYRLRQLRFLERFITRGNSVRAAGLIDDTLTFHLRWMNLVTGIMGLAAAYSNVRRMTPGYAFNPCT